MVTKQDSGTRTKLSFERIKDLILGVLMAGFSIFYYINIGKIKTNKMIMGKHAAYANGQIVPYLLFGLISILSLVLIVQGAIRLIKKTEVKQKEGEKADYLAVICTFFIIVVYIVLLPQLGFILTTMLFLFAQISVLAPKKGKKYWLYAVVAVVFTAFVYVAFRLGLNQPLPRGVIENLLNI